MPYSTQSHVVFSLWWWWWWWCRSKVLGDDDAPSGHPSVSSSMKAALTVSTDPSVSATSSVQSAQLQVFTEVDVAYVLDQLPSSVPAPRGGVPHWPQPRLSMAMLETQVRDFYCHAHCYCHCFRYFDCDCEH